MKKAIVIFTGINFSHYMAEYAVKWAARNKTSLLVLFLKASKEEEEGYPFPSDLDAAEKLTDRRDAEKDDLILIHDYQKLVEDLAREYNVSAAFEVLSDPPMEKIVSFTRDAAIVFADGSYDSEDILSPKGFDLEKLQEKSQAPVEIIRES